MVAVVAAAEAVVIAAVAVVIDQELTDWSSCMNGVGLRNVSLEFKRCMDMDSS